MSRAQEMPRESQPAAEIEMQESVCALCGSHGGQFVMSSVDRLHRLPGTFALVRCTTCDLVRLSPRPVPEVLSFYYPSEYYAYQSGSTLPGYQRALQTLLTPLRRLLRHSGLASRGYGLTSRGRVRAGRRGRVLERSLLLQRVAGYPWEIPPAMPNGLALDVGCGSGRFLSSLVPLGWQVRGVDTSPDAARAAVGAFGIPVHVGPLESVPGEPGSVDFIHMRHVIEHVEDPAGLVRRAFELLRPGGWLYVETPNIESYPAAMCGPYWFGVDSPRHLWLFGPATLRRCLAEGGFEVERMWSFVVIRLCSWESTYRREESLDRQLRWRPSLSVRDVPRAAILSVRARLGVHRNRLSGDIIACWAQKPVVVTEGP